MMEAEKKISVRNAQYDSFRAILGGGVRIDIPDLYLAGVFWLSIFQLLQAVFQPIQIERLNDEKFLVYSSRIAVCDIQTRACEPFPLAKGDK